MKNILAGINLAKAMRLWIVLGLFAAVASGSDAAETHRDERSSISEWGTVRISKGERALEVMFPNGEKLVYQGSTSFSCDRESVCHCYGFEDCFALGTSGKCRMLDPSQPDMRCSGFGDYVHCVCAKAGSPIGGGSLFGLVDDLNAMPDFY